MATIIIRFINGPINWNAIRWVLYIGYIVICFRTGDIYIFWGVIAILAAPILLLIDQDRKKYHGTVFPTFNKWKKYIAQKYEPIRKKIVGRYKSWTIKPRG